MTAAAIETQGLEKRFGDRQAVRPFAAAIAAGEVTGLLGPNGSGKSTFLRTLVGLVRPDAGRARVAGVELAGDGTAVRRHATYMPGEAALYGELSGRRHLAWLLRGRGARTRQRGEELARALELPLENSVRGFSHGMKRMLLFAAALAPDVGVRILDEPTEGLDPTRRAQVLELLRAEAARGCAVLLSSHHLGEVAHACARILCLHQGALLADERADALRERAQALLQLDFQDGVDAAALAGRLSELGAREVRAAGARAAIELEDTDPRAFLARLAADRTLPAPRALSYGRPSLQELYRELYGVEGI